MKLALRDVTLVAIDTAVHDLTRLAVEECLRRATFHEVLIFSDRRIKVRGGEHRLCRAANAEEAFQFRWYDVPKYIRTSHFLIVEWDSWIINADMWSPAFLQFDYVGAPWWYNDEFNVGNGGFSLRSAKLASYVASRPEDYPIIHPEDHALCRTYRRKLEQAGFRWADEATASDFSIEHTAIERDGRHFGFHGMGNWPAVLTLPEIGKRMRYFNQYVVNHAHFRYLLAGLAVRYDAKTPMPHGLLPQRQSS